MPRRACCPRSKRSSPTSAAGSMVALVDEREGGDGVLCMRRRARHARSHQLHGDPRARARSASASPRVACVGSASRCSGTRWRRRASRPSGRRSRRASGVTTGISAGDRARDHPRDGRRRHGARAISRCPGTCFRSRSRAAACSPTSAIPKASVDLMRLAGMRPAAVFCTVLCEDGVGRDARRHRAPRRASTISA